MMTKYLSHEREQLEMLTFAAMNIKKLANWTWQVA
jgi:hypothetical protein